MCSSSLTSGKVREVTGSSYSHAALHLGNGKIAESASSGVRITSILEIFDEYDDVAVLRNVHVWSSDRIDNLKQFIDKAILDNASFNSIGIKKYEKRKEQYTGSELERLERYFEGELPTINHNRGSYFCSELVVAAFMAVGIIDQSAAVLLAPEVFSPGDIGKEATFGEFVGYLGSSNDIDISKDDDFYYHSPIESPDLI